MKRAQCGGRGHRGRACRRLGFHTRSAPPEPGYSPGRRARGHPDQRPTSTAGGSAAGAPALRPQARRPRRAASTADRTATGAAVNYNYGVLSVAATVSGTKLTNVTIASIDEGGNFRSQSIDQQAIPILEQEALQAQSANIQGVSGASYTSCRFPAVLAVRPHPAGFPVTPVQLTTTRPTGRLAVPPPRRSNGHRRDHRPFRRRRRHAPTAPMYAWRTARPPCGVPTPYSAPGNEHSPISQLRRGEITVGASPSRGGRRAGSVRDGPVPVPRLVRSLGDAGRRRPDWVREGLGGPAPLTAPSPGQAVTGAIVNAAGDIATFGVPGNGKALQDRHRRPGRSATLACVVELTGAIATSGTYERGEHLIDPQTGERQSRVASASVTGPDLGLADALATALAVAGEVGLGFIEPIDGYEGFIIGLDGSWKSTRHFPFAPMLNAPRADNGR